jgi:hypothetical protein
MSRTVNVIARCKISRQSLADAQLYNQLIAGSHDVPLSLTEKLRSALGDDACECWGSEPISIDDSQKTIDISVDGSGDACYSEGLTISASDIPPDVLELIIYVS